MTSRLLLRRLSSGSSEAGSSTTGGEDTVSDEPLHGNMFATTALSGVAGAGNATTFGNVTTFESPPLPEALFPPADATDPKFAAFCTTAFVGTKSGRPNKVYENWDRDYKVETSFQGQNFSWELKVPQEKLEAYIYPSLSGKRKPLVKQRDAKDKDDSSQDGIADPLFTQFVASPRGGGHGRRGDPASTEKQHQEGQRGVRGKWHLCLNDDEYSTLLQGNSEHQRAVAMHQNEKDPLWQVRKGGENMLRHRLVDQAQSMLIEDAKVLKGAISREVHRALRTQFLRRPSAGPAIVYYDLVRGTKARTAVRRVDTLNHYKNMLHKNHATRWPWMPHANRDHELAILYYQKRQAFDVLRQATKLRKIDVVFKSAMSPKLKTLVQAKIQKENREADHLYQQVKQRLRFFERYHRTVKALENGMEIRNNKIKLLAPVKDAGSSPMARGTLTGTLGSPQLRNTGQGEDDALSITTSAMLQTGDMLPKKRTTLNSGFNTASGLFGTVTSPDALKPEGRPELRATFMTGGATARRNSGLRAFYNAIAQEVALTKATDSFLYHCELQGLVPEPSFMRKFEKPAVDLSHFAMGDAFGLALARSIPHVETLTSLNVSDNRLTATSLLELFKGMHPPPGLTDRPTPLIRLDVSENAVGGDAAAVHALVQLVSHSHSLEELRLARAQLGTEEMAQLVGSLYEHPSMSEVNVSDNILGPESCHRLANALASPKCRIKTLIVSWGQIDTRGAAVLGQALARNTSLATLDLSNNSLDNHGGQMLGEALKTNKTLRRLVLKHGGIGGQAALALSNALRINQSLRILELDGNPLTEEGGRALLRSIISGLGCTVSFRGCSYMYTHDVAFSCTAPRIYSPYTLDMERPVDAAILFELCVIASRNPGCEFQNVMQFDLSGSEREGSLKRTGGGRKIELDYKPGDANDRFGRLVERSTGKVFEPPPKGILTFSMKHRRKLPDRKRDVLTPEELETLLRALLSMDRREFEDCLALVSDDIYLTTRQVDQIIRRVHEAKMYETHMDEVVSVLSRVYSRLVDCEYLYDLLVKQLPQTHTRQVLANRLTLQTFRCNTINMSGHWHVDLSQKSHRNVVMLLAAINDEESYNSKTSAGRGDTSQTGNWCNFRNETMNNTPIVLTNENVDELPRHGVLEFDYVNTTRPPPDAQPVSDNYFADFVSRLGVVLDRRVWKVLGVFSIYELTLAVCRDYFSASQVLALVDCLPEGHMQPLVVCAMFSRIVDLHNFDRIMRKLAPDLARDVVRRLGWLNVFNPMKPAWRYELDLRVLDQRIMTQMVLNLGAADTNGDAIMEESDTQVAVMSLYATLGRILEIPQDATACFSYAETLERGVTPNWTARQAALRFVLLGTKPVNNGVVDVMRKYEELQRLNLLRAGNVEDQYQAYQDGAGVENKTKKTSRGAPGSRRRSNVDPSGSERNSLNGGSLTERGGSLSGASGGGKRNSALRKESVVAIPLQAVLS